MSGLIPHQFIEDLLARIDIVEVVESRISLKKKGREYMACCPFHNEKTPSFSVSPSKQFYHCFGCGAHGSAVNFLMEYEGLGFPEAIEELASLIGLNVPREAQSDADAIRRRALYDILDMANQYFQRQLRDHPQSADAKSYLKGRGLSGEVAKQFHIGYAPVGWDGLQKELLGQSCTHQDLLDAGLAIKNERGQFYDRFRQRIMFPIHNRRGQIVGFGGRALGDGTPKYLNSPETRVFHKGNELYGLYQARQALRELSCLLVVEGYMDVVSLAQFEIYNVVATLGTATTVEQLNRMFRVAPELVFCFDGDRAGRQAAWKALDNALSIMQGGRQIRFLFLPEGEDPDSEVRKHGKEAFLERIKQAMPLSDFLFDSLAKGNDYRQASADEKYSYCHRVSPLINKIPDKIYRHLLIEKFAKSIEMDADKLSTLISPAGEIKTSDLSGTPKAKKTLKRSSLIRTAIRLLLEKPSLAEVVDTHQIEGLQLRGIDFFLQLVDLLVKNKDLHLGGVLELFRESTHFQHLSDLASQNIDIPFEGIDDEFKGIVNRLIAQKKEQRFDELTRKLASQSALSDEELLEMKNYRRND